MRNHAFPAPLDHIALQTGHRFQLNALQDHTALLQALPLKMPAFSVKLGDFKTALGKRIVTYVPQGRIATTTDVLWRHLAMLVRATREVLQRIVFSVLLGSINLKKDRYCANHVHPESTAARLVFDLLLEIAPSEHFQLEVHHLLLAQFVPLDLTATRQDFDPQELFAHLEHSLMMEQPFVKNVLRGSTRAGLGSRTVLLVERGRTAQEAGCRLRRLADLGCTTLAAGSVRAASVLRGSTRA